MRGEDEEMDEKENEREGKEMEDQNEDDREEKEEEDEREYDEREDKKKEEDAEDWEGKGQSMQYCKEHSLRNKCNNSVQPLLSREKEKKGLTDILL